jgi:hypothetical protein
MKAILFACCALVALSQVNSSFDRFSICNAKFRNSI